MRFIHIADVHLGAEPDAGFSWSRQRSKEIWETFQRVIQQVKKERMDLLIISGDLFHRQPLVRELKEVNYLFSSIPETQVILLAGNHDYLKKGSAYTQFSWAPNVTGLWEPECHAVFLPSVQTWIYGCSYYSREIRTPLYDNVRPNGEKGYHILAAHGGDETHSPMNYRTMLSAGFDYIALGHIHKPQIPAENKIAYAGALEPIDRNDLGPHGYIEGVCTRNGTEIRFVPFAVRSYEILKVPVDEQTTQYELERKVRMKIEERGSENIYKIHLCGSREAGAAFDTEGLKQIGNVVEVCDESHISYDWEQLLEMYEGTLIGKYIERFREAKTETEKKALYYGVEALLQAKR